MPVAGDTIAARASFAQIRYAQVWEDADVLLAALRPPPGAELASIASAGDNVLALLTTDPARVHAIDLSAAQLACLRLRISAYRVLDHQELLELMGSRPSDRRADLLARTVQRLDASDQVFWAARRDAVVRHGAGGVGKFERYFRIFRRFVLPLVHGRKRIAQLLTARDAGGRAAFYDRYWDNARWRLMLRLFFSRTTMGRLGRDPAFFTHAEGSLAAQVAGKTRAALVEQNPVENPYLHWILTGYHGVSLPLALRAEHFDAIRARLDRIVIHLGALEDVALGEGSIDGWNLSDVFEYMPSASHLQLYRALLDKTRIGGRLVYWNMMVPRRVPDALADRVNVDHSAASALSRQDKAFFYSALVIEERAV